jgi:ribosomal protein S9
MRQIIALGGGGFSAQDQLVRHIVFRTIIKWSKPNLKQSS